MAASKAVVKIIPLGGLGEVGKNMIVVECGPDMVVIDCGIMFPDEEMLGVDLVLPDFDYVVKNASKLRGVVLTHGHEDHIGAVAYLLREVNPPIYGTKLTLGFLGGRLKEHNNKNAKLREITPGKPLQLGNLKLEFLRVSHSIPDGVGIVIHTPLGIVMHSGDFKFDQTPIDGRPTELDRFASYQGRVLVLLSDSTNVERMGYTQPERGVGDNLREIVRAAKQRVIVTCFASHIHRIQQAMDAAAESGRKIAVAGRSMTNNVEIASELGYLKIPPGSLMDLAKIGKVPANQVLIITTGSQGEPLSALTRIAARNHRQVELVRGDTVIVSASPIPGNEKAVGRVINLLFKAGAKVFYRSVADIHVSGHAARGELLTLLKMVKPKYFIPIHGEFRMLSYHAQLAEEAGVKPKNIMILENGQVAQFTANKANSSQRVQSGVKYVDGLGVGDIGNVVLRDRQLLSQDGVCIVVVAVSEEDGRLVSGPDIMSRGFVYVKESAQLMEEAKQEVVKLLRRDTVDNVSDWSIMVTEVRDMLSRFFYRKTGRRPMIMPIVMEL